MTTEVNGIGNFIKEFIEDYEQMGKDKEPELWLKEAIARKIPGITEEEAEKIKNELLKGINRYREAREKKTTLSSVLKNAGQYAKDLYKKVMKEIEELLKRTGIDDQSVIDKIKEEEENE